MVHELDAAQSQSAQVPSAVTAGAGHDIYSGAMEFSQNVLLGPMTTLGVGGPSRWFCEVHTEDELQAAVGWAAECRLPLFVLGGGSNLVISNEGWPGLTLRVQLRGLNRSRDDGKECFQAGAGEDWDSL